MSDRNPVDLVILGGGCAGLSLATQLVTRAPSLRVLIVEPRLVYEEDRTWCGWRIQPHLFEDCVVAAWPEWRVVVKAQEIKRHSHLYPYEMVRSDLFYAKALASISASANCSLLQGLSASTCTSSETGVRVALSDGSTAVGSWVIDTRPKPIALKKPWLWQHFVGFVLHFADDQPSFPNIPTLMDFQPSGSCVAQFMYVLPLGSGEFLCEWTQFSSKALCLPELETPLLTWLGLHVPAGWKLVRRESGSLPMALAARPTQGRVVTAGTHGGSMRASSGYAFHAIQRWSESCAASLATNGRPVPPRRNPLLDVMDCLFLEVLQQPSCSVPELFGTLFRESPTDPLIRFLAGRPRWNDVWPVVRSLPWSRFLRAGLTAAYSWSLRR